jgi:prolyl-tRNA editing enzyme YbaK/EbsC (Cys-tRNA(Pro) deacylase)
MMDTLTLHRLLLGSGVQHEIIHLHNSISSADQLPTALELPFKRCLAVRIYEAGEPGRQLVLVAAIVWAGRVPAIGELRRITGLEWVRRAAAATVNEATGYAAGLVAPLALPEEADVYADENVVSGIDHGTVVYTATGEPRTALGIRLPDLFALCPAKLAALGVTGPVPAQGMPRGEIRATP